jgi:uncharacterized protein (TIGR00297 family)
MLVWMIGFICSLLIAGAAWLKRSLSASGAAAAVLVGTTLYALGNLQWFGTLIVFFVTSTALTKWKHKRKAAVESGYAKSGRRDAGQVFANGGLGALLCIAQSVWPHPLWWAAYVGVMATVTADTWATEIGGLSRSQPRSITNGHTVPAGTSGGITVLGLAASLSGGLVIGAAGWLFSLWGSRQELTAPSLFASGTDLTLGVGLLVLGAVAGMAGSLSDSWLGAVWQVMYRCPVCGKEIEKNRHCGGAQAVRIRGLSFMTNDAVNMISSVIGGAVSIAISSYYFV